MHGGFLLLLASAAMALGESNQLEKRTEAPPTNGTEYQGNCEWINQGCYEEPVTGHIVSDRSQDTAMTPEKCLEHCGSLHYNWALLEYRNECWCGFTADLSGGKWNGTGTGCRLACAGDGSQWCGGQSKGQLFQKNPDASACITTTASTCVPETTQFYTDTTTVTYTTTEPPVSLTFTTTATETGVVTETGFIISTETQTTTLIVPTTIIQPRETTTETGLVISTETQTTTLIIPTTIIQPKETTTSTETQTTTLTTSLTFSTTSTVTVPTTHILTITSQSKETVTVTNIQTASITITTTASGTCTASTTKSTPTCTATTDNSSFEQGNNDSWSLYKSGSTTYTSGEFHDQTSHTGTNSYRFAFQKQASSNSYLTLKQEVKLCTGKKYTITGWTKRPVAACGCVANFFLDDVLVAVSNNDNSSGWAQVKSVGTIKSRGLHIVPRDGGVEMLKVVVSCPGRYDNVAELFLDDVSLVVT